jgi:hypothetical protein
MTDRSWTQRATLEFLRGLALDLHAAGRKLERTFRYGIPGAREATGEKEALFDEALEIAGLLARAGLEPGFTLELGIPTAIAEAKGDARFEQRAMAMARALAEAGIDPRDSLCWGVPVLKDHAGSDGAAFEKMASDLENLVFALHVNGIESRDVLYYDIPSLRDMKEVRSESFSRFLGAMRSLLEALQRSSIPPEPTLDFVIEALEGAEALASGGVDPGPFLEKGVPALASEPPDDGEVRRERLRVLTRFCLDVATAQDPVPDVLRFVVPPAARVGGGDGKTFERLLEALRDRLKEVRESGDDPEILGETLPFLADLTGGEVEAFNREAGRIAESIPGSFARGFDPRGFLYFGLPAVATVAGKDATVFRSLFKGLAAQARSLDGSDLDGYEFLKDVAWAVASVSIGDPEAFLSRLREIGSLASSLGDDGVPAAEFFSDGVRIARAVGGTDGEAFMAVLPSLAPEGVPLAPVDGGEDFSLRGAGVGPRNPRGDRFESGGSRMGGHGIARPSGPAVGGHQLPDGGSGDDLPFPRGVPGGGLRVLWGVQGHTWRGLPLGGGEAGKVRGAW